MSVAAIHEAEAESDRFAALRLGIDRWIAAIDEAVSAQLDAVMRHPRFRKLEAAWRGLRHLVDTADLSGDIKIRLFQAKWSELCHDFEKSGTFDSSTLFQKIHEQEFGLAGGEPFGLLLGDYQIAHKATPEERRGDTVAALASIAKVAAAAFSPFVANASPALFGLDTHTELAPAVDMMSSDRRSVVGVVAPDYFRDMTRESQYQRWRALRGVEEARFLALVLPNCLIRAPGDAPAVTEIFRGRLTREANSPDDFLFASGIYAFGAIVIAAYARSGWFADMRGARRGDDSGGGLAPGLPVSPFPTDAPDIAPRAPLEIEIDYVQERTLDELGLIPLVRAAGAPEALIRSTASLYSGAQAGAAANADVVLSAMFQYILCVSRFAHYLKVIGRDLVGARVTASECQTRLRQWIIDYTNSDDSAGPEILAKRPLREARIEVRDNPAVSGGYLCRAWLRPHFLLDRIVSAFEISTEFGRPSDSGAGGET